MKGYGLLKLTLFDYFVPDIARTDRKGIIVLTYNIINFDEVTGTIKREQNSK